MLLQGEHAKAMTNVEVKKKQVQGELHQVQLATLLQLWAVTWEWFVVVDI